VRRKRKLIPTPEEVQKIVQAAFDKAALFGLYVYIVATLGLRRGEACALRWENLDFKNRIVHVRLTVARQRGGSYIKPPKSGEERSLVVGADFFDRLEPFRRERGWLFPRAYNCPYENASGISPQSTAGRLLALLDAHGGSMARPDGRAGTKAAMALGLGRYSLSPAIRYLANLKLVATTSKPRHIYEIALTPNGRQAIAGWTAADGDDLPWFATTASQKFRELMRELDLAYGLHSLRHFVATHLYNRMRDWVQLAKFLGHANPSVTMDLYSNHVVEVSQIALGQAATELFSALTVLPTDPGEGGKDARPAR
jgi:integrase